MGPSGRKHFHILILEENLVGHLQALLMTALVQTSLEAPATSPVQSQATFRLNLLFLPIEFRPKVAKLTINSEGSESDVL
jgi:hypothetical protein